ncbi:unnamed protein product [Caenorhabditis nigoni]
MIGSIAAHQRKDKDGYGWDHEDNSEEDYAPIGSQPKTLILINYNTEGTRTTTIKSSLEGKDKIRRNQYSLESGSTYKSRHWETESSKSSCGGRRVMMSVGGTVERSVVDISQPEEPVASRNQRQDVFIRLHSNWSNSTMIGSIAAHQRKDKDGYGWDHEDNSEEDYAPIGSQPKTLILIN